jgi:hypothetical protein
MYTTEFTSNKLPDFRNIESILGGRLAEVPEVSPEIPFEIANQSYYWDLAGFHKTYVDHTLFDEILNCSNHCVEFIYETVLYIYCGQYYNDLL